MTGVAAAVVVFGGAAVTVAPQVFNGAVNQRDSAGSGFSAARPELATESPRALTDQGAPRASGTDYDAATLSTLGAAAAQKHPDTSAEGAGPGIRSAPSAPGGDLTGVPDALRRLTEPAARTACLDAVVNAYQASTVSLIDYARYKGTPALVVVVDGAYRVADRKWVVVVGPDCGTGNAIGEQKYNAQLG